MYSNWTISISDTDVINRFFYYRFEHNHTKKINIANVKLISVRPVMAQSVVPLESLGAATTRADLRGFRGNTEL